MVNRGLLHFGVILTIFALTNFSDIAEGSNVSCESLFKSPAPRRVSSSIGDKFVKSGDAGHFYQIGDLKIGTIASVHVRTAQLGDVEAKQAEAYFDALSARGLKIEAPPGEFANHEGPDVVLRGSVDLVLAAMRHPAVEAIHKIEQWGSSVKLPYFSKSTLGTFEKATERPLGDKFESKAGYARFRKSLFDRVGTEFSMTVLTVKSDRQSVEFLRLVEDIQGLQIGATQVTLATGETQLTLLGPIDALYSVIRHPGIEKVIGFKTHRPRWLTTADLVENNPGAAKIELVEKSAMPDEDFFMRPDQSALERRSFFGFRDAAIPSLIRLQRESHQNIVYENQTARDYAKYVRRHHGRDFAFVSELNERSVPLFDGMILDADTQAPVENVSLKFHTKKMRLSISNLEFELRRRFSDEVEKKRLLELANWFAAVNHSGTVRKARFDYEEWLLRATKLATLFGLYDRASGGDRLARPTNLVIDVRQHGYSVEFFKRPEVQLYLRELIAEQGADAPQTITYLWDDRRGVEATALGVIIYE